MSGSKAANIWKSKWTLSWQVCIWKKTGERMSETYDSKLSHSLVFVHENHPINKSDAIHTGEFQTKVMAAWIQKYHYITALWQWALIHPIGFWSCCLAVLYVEIQLDRQQNRRSQTDSWHFHIYFAYFIITQGDAIIINSYRHRLFGHWSRVLGVLGKLYEFIIGLILCQEGVRIDWFDRTMCEQVVANTNQRMRISFKVPN